VVGLGEAQGAWGFWGRAAGGEAEQARARSAAGAGRPVPRERCGD
jgi:hypothetical protein